ncbi:MAG TPA: inorganic phosphate transporter [Burkholderiales bacterium]|nr:inorganic phosphate transporter [Burkholderiales bacterium]
MSITFEVVVFLVAVALVFDFFNGFHDAANSIATIVSTGAMSPRWAVAWAAFFNFVAFLVFGAAVASTVGKGIIDLSIVDHHVVFGALCGAIAWNLITWYYGIPSSSSHALVGGLCGAAIAKGGVHTLVPAGVIKTSIAIVLSPLFGFVLAVALMIAVSWIFHRSTPKRVDRWFRYLQFVSAAFYSIGHGGNDAQKTMGIVAGALYAAGYMSREQLAGTWGHWHWPIILLAHTAMGLGTYFGGWRIVHTMGQKITKLKPFGGFCAEAAGSITLFGTALAGIPVSTTHTITGAIVGVGAVNRLSAVRWGVAGRIVWAWILTIPAAALVAALTFWLLHLAHPGA